MRHDAMKAYVQALDARDFVLLCNVVREERRRRESSAAGFTVIAGLLDLLEMTSTAAFGAIGAVVPGTRVHILARVCRRARKIVDRALLASLLGLVLRPKPSASKQQLESLAFGRLGSGTVQLLLDRGMDSLIAPLIDRMQVAVKQQAWGGLRSLRIAGCPNIEVYNSGEEEPPAWEAPAGLSSPMIQLCQLLPSFCLLEKLELVESGLSNEAACQIAEGIASARNLKTLDLSGNDIGEEGAHFLAAGLDGGTEAHGGPLIQLERLDLSANDLRGGVNALASYIMRNSNLRELNLFNNGVDDREWVDLMAALGRASQLTSLNLGFNNMGVHGAAGLSEAIIRDGGLCALGELCLGSNDLGDCGACALAQALGYLTRLVRLDLDENNISAKGMFYLASHLVTLTKLSQLHLQGNPLNEEGTSHLLFLMPCNKATCYVDHFYQSLHPFLDRIVVGKYPD